ncbi:alpha,alpha-trehalase [Dictyocaulus viviparus]|uniref:Trehalase n=1 Tax=Dictyocaulus viviparus TaxID=29172 RepID=A0A0D8XTR0_DICVI|nr:alpha,alpha-trehalase [Dictyocaulus viviparus]
MQKSIRRSINSINNITHIKVKRDASPLIKTEVCDEINAPNRYMIYCSGKLLQAVMATHLYSDSKTFVDKPMKEGRTGTQLIKEFETLFPQPVDEISKDDVRQFVDENFEEEGHELQSCEIADWTENPPRFNVIQDNALRKFANKLNKIWKKLCRTVKLAVKESPSRFSLIYVPHPFIIPGGRFREFYYWDAYWIVKGLLASGMNDTARSMILNFAHMINIYGFVPNGGRIYYLRRSQPPMFAPMVYEYYQATRDKEIVRDMLPIIEKEYRFWQNNRSVSIDVNGETIEMFQYRTPSTVPSAAESGWDFSIRWFADKNSLTSIQTTNILPVDLNAFICYNLHILGTLHGEIGNRNKSSIWIARYIKFREQFEKIFYVNNASGWYDYNLKSKKHNTDFYASIAVPLFTQCYEPLSTVKTNDLYAKMEEMGVFSFKGGIPTSLQTQSTQQWDFPNGWSPLNHMIVEGLRKSSDPRMQQKAFILAQKWVLANMHVFQADNAMWEKYDVVSSHPRLGMGGEYNVQPGFGWTNGVALDLLISYGDRMQYSDITNTRRRPINSSSIFNNKFNAFVISIISIWICMNIV